MSRNQLLIVAAIVLSLGFVLGCTQNAPTDASAEQAQALAPASADIQPYQTPDGTWWVPEIWIDSTADPQSIAYIPFQSACDSYLSCWTNSCWDWYISACRQDVPELEHMLINLW